MQVKKHQPKKISKEELIYDTIWGMCMRLGPNGRLPTVSRLCETIGASRSTLDRVLRRLEEDNLVVCRHGSGIFVSPQLTKKTIALVFGHGIYGERYSPFWRLLLDAARQLAERFRHELRVYYDCPSKDDADKAYHISKDASAGRIDAFLAPCSAPQREWMLQWNRPIVALSSRGPSTASVSVDPAHQMGMAIKGLKRAGCRRIALMSVAVAPLEDKKSPGSVVQKFEELLAENGLEADDQLLWPMPWGKAGLEQATFEEFGFHMAREHFGVFKSRATAPADGVVVVDDMLARGVIAWLHKAGWPLGKKVHLAAFTNTGSPVLKFFNDEIIRVEASPLSLVEAMFDVLEGAMSGRVMTQNTVTIQPQLILPPYLCGE